MKHAFLSDGIQNGFQLAPANCGFSPAHQSNYMAAINAELKLAVEQTILSEIAEGNCIALRRSIQSPVLISQ